MREAMRQPEPAWHSRLAFGYLCGSLIALFLSGLALVTAAPLFIKVFLPFPQLEDASHWRGRVDIEGREELGRLGVRTIPRNFINTSTGRHEFKCGYLGYRIPCSEYRFLQGATGEVWYHPVFGALQWRFVAGPGPFEGRIVERSIAAREAFHREDFAYGRYVERLLMALVMLALAGWQFWRHRRHRASAELSSKS